MILNRQKTRLIRLDLTLSKNKTIHTRSLYSASLYYYSPYRTTYSGYSTDIHWRYVWTVHNYQVNIGRLIEGRFIPCSYVLYEQSIFTLIYDHIKLLTQL